MTTSPVVSVTDELIAELERSVECVWPETDNAVVALRGLLAERSELKRDAERWRSVREMLSDMVELHRARGTVLTIHLDTLRECLEGMQSEEKQ